MAVSQDISRVIGAADYQVDFLPKAKVELAVDDSIAEQVMEAVCNVARSGNLGDGKVWVLELNKRCGCAPVKRSRRHLAWISGLARSRARPIDRFDSLGASRAGKPANSPVGAISRRRRYLKKGLRRFLYHAPDARRRGPFIPQEISTGHLFRQIML